MNLRGGSGSGSGHHEGGNSRGRDSQNGNGIPAPPGSGAAAVTSGTTAETAAADEAAPEDSAADADMHTGIKLPAGLASNVGAVPDVGADVSITDRSSAAGGNVSLSSPAPAAASSDAFDSPDGPFGRSLTSSRSEGAPPINGEHRGGSRQPDGELLPGGGDQNKRSSARNARHISSYDSGAGHAGPPGLGVGQTAAASTDNLHLSGNTAGPHSSPPQARLAPCGTATCSASTPLRLAMVGVDALVSAMGVPSDAQLALLFAAPRVSCFQVKVLPCMYPLPTSRYTHRIETFQGTRHASSRAAPSSHAYKPAWNSCRCA